eukprot:CAMPEP_0203654540 /NCGR_PEP_ID=MMETSP0088-20131115/35523_1 /ASSEMBLY_ACC=CAM_ASM_001087 /TAXON_ID=426623 /ORGANISM="Chaetoceros affinis, Strain CCMP159" /LENGTH=60 /DNA_ID=CAMNT_0050514847 /DNA_START=148 /DNA_END=327 /DNA_ORIENTATION=-
MTIWVYCASWLSVGQLCQFPKYAIRRESSAAVAVVGGGKGVGLATGLATGIGVEATGAVG